MMMRNNVYVFHATGAVDVHRYNAPMAAEVGGLMPGGAAVGPQDIVVRARARQWPSLNTPRAMYACNVHARVAYDEVLLSGLSSKQYRIRTAQAQEHCPFSHALSASFPIVKSSTLCSGEEGAGGAAGHLLVLSYPIY